MRTSTLVQGSVLSEVGLVVTLLVAVIPLVALAQRANVSYPIVLVVSGLVLSFIPGLPKVQLDPNIVLLIFLPPLLYWEAITAPTEIMRENAGQIAVLAVGLVIITTIAVAVVAHAVVPHMSWAVAFILGAIVSPTDELAAIPVLEHFRLPRYVIAIVEGESLLNDATALVVYATAIVVASTGTFSPATIVLQFVEAVIGSISIGYLAGRIAVALWRRIKDRQLQGVISVTASFLAYIPATQLGLSGVLAVVVAGIYVSRYTPRVMTPAARTQIAGFWNTIVFIANAVLFLVVGLQLHDIAIVTFTHNSWPVVIGYSLLVNVIVIVVRLAIVELAEYAPTAAPADHSEPNWRNALVVGWSGLRGAVSLAAALAIPLTLSNGAPFPYRDLIIFITFSVILVTLVAGGLTLPKVVSVLKIVGGDEVHQEFRLATLRTAEAAIARLGELETEGRIDPNHAEYWRNRFEHRRELQLTEQDSIRLEHAAQEAEIERELIAVQRKTVIDMRDRGEIDNVVLRKFQSELDLQATRPSLGLDAGNQ